MTEARCGFQRPRPAPLPWSGRGVWCCWGGGGSVRIAPRLRRLLLPLGGGAAAGAGDRRDRRVAWQREVHAGPVVAEVLRDLAHGSVSLSGVDLRALDGRELYRKIAVVFQDVHLFDGTIEENLRRGHPGADKAAMRAAAAADRLDEVVERLGGVGR
ncbi:hypothetical protein AB0B79_39540 [Streptomyces sp. NPDC039022]|uniref:hypothetical protein n=1 Tax=Streptomyces sp. NPDC039022 TaxID=3157091 RepID=UPI0033FD5CFD